MSRGSLFQKLLVVKQQLRVSAFFTKATNIGCLLKKRSSCLPGMKSTSGHWRDADLCLSGYFRAIMSPQVTIRVLILTIAPNERRYLNCRALVTQKCCETRALKWWLTFEELEIMYKNTVMSGCPIVGRFHHALRP